MANKYYMVCSGFWVLVLSLATGLSVGRAQELQPPVPPQTEEPAAAGQPEVLEQGPIHEAFAEPLALEEQDPLVAPRKPPEPVEELPPEVRPEGRNVQWIPGYFQWQEDLQDFVWVSGFYRDIPPGREWVPGTWTEVDGGWQWTSGFWAEGNPEELNYLPAPPATLEQGPSSPAPGDNYLWAPGCWRWYDGAYAWQPGYWYEGRPDWVWVPSYYSYTPRGYVYVSGFWDFPFASRGLLYAPIYWRGGWGLHVGYRYRPYFALNTSLLAFNLFIDGGHRHYYYGYHGKGRPGWVHDWGHGYGKHGRRDYHDPLWAQHNWDKKHGRGNFDRGDFSRDGRRGLDRDGRGSEGRGRGESRMVTTPDRLAKDNSRVKLRHLDEKEMTAQRNRVERFRRSSEKRVDGSAGANSQANVRGEIRRRSESSSTRTHLRSEGDGTAKRGRQGDSSPVDNRGQRSLGRGASRLKSGADVETADVTQGQRSRNWERNRTTRENQSAFSTERREQSRSRAGSTDSPNTRTYRSSRGSATFRQQTSGATARVQQGNNATSSTAPRTNYHVMRSPSISGSNARVQHRSPQTRTYTPSRGGQQAARIRSSQRSSGGGAGWNGGSQSRSRSMSSGNWSGGGSRSFSAGGRGSRSFSGGGRGGGGGGGGHGGHGGRGRR